MGSNFQLEILIIDPQNDFTDGVPGATLGVPGAWQDAERLARMLNRLKSRIDDIHVTLDTHQMVDISHPVFWVDSAGNHPAPFTQIAVADVINGKWRTYNPAFQTRAHEYVQALKGGGRYDLTIWPPHCLVGTPGHNVVEPVRVAIAEWEADFARVDFVTKGHNPWTEHYSAVQADVPDPDDPTTLLNTRLIETLENADVVALSGQALSHCVANTVRDIADNFGDANIGKLVLIEDTTSPVPGFEDLGRQFVADLKKRGMKTALSTDFMK